MLNFGASKLGVMGAQAPRAPRVTLDPCLSPKILIQCNQVNYQSRIVWVFGFLSAGHETEGFYQISIIMGISSLGATKYHINIVHKTKEIFAVTMEFSTKHLACFTLTVQVGWNQLKPAQSSLVSFSAHDKECIAWLSTSLLLWTLTMDVV